MGREVPAIVVSQQDRRRYREKVGRCLDVFARMLRESRFKESPQKVGLEVEFNLVNDTGGPAMRNAEVLASIGGRPPPAAPPQSGRGGPAWSSSRSRPRPPGGSEAAGVTGGWGPAGVSGVGTVASSGGAAGLAQWAPELGQFNIEVNLAPRPLIGDALAELEQHLAACVAEADDRAAAAGARLAMIGILPTLRAADAVEERMSPNPRYRLLNEQICAARGEEVRICIEGTERLLTHVASIMPEAAGTSVQCHLQVSPEEFGSYWNAAQAVAGVQVALGANAPFLFGRELWRETRIPLFQQATDTRSVELQAQGVRPRVWFGERWITSVFDLFEENMRYFPALLPLCEDEDPLAELERGATPLLAELTLHNGTVWRWNRPVYAVDDGQPHLRVENRVLPAGPTVTDMVANAAFYYGLVQALAEEERPIWSQMSFAVAHDNLMEAARHGIEASLYWPGLGEVPAVELTLRRLLPLAREGLRRWQVDDDDAEHMLAVIEQRCLTGRTGATWQTETVRALQERRGLDRGSALSGMTGRYLDFMRSGEPVHTWPVG